MVNPHGDVGVTLSLPILAKEALMYAFTANCVQRTDYHCLSFQLHFKRHQKSSFITRVHVVTLSEDRPSRPWHVLYFTLDTDSYMLHACRHMSAARILDPKYTCGTSRGMSKTSRIRHTSALTVNRLHATRSLPAA